MIREVLKKMRSCIAVFRNVTGEEETTQVSHVRTHLNTSLNTLDIRLYIPTNKSEYAPS